MYTERTPAPGRHLNEVISSSLLRDADRFRPRVTDTPVNFTVLCGGTAAQILHLFERRIQAATCNTTYVVHPFHNSIRHINEFEVIQLLLTYSEMVDDINDSRGSRHRLVWAECDLPPELSSFFPLIDRINMRIRAFNHLHRVPPCRPHRVSTPERRGRRATRLNRWREHVNGTGLGYHIAERYMYQYVNYFRNYLRHA